MSACKHEECTKQTVARGYCMGHYRRILRHGDPDTVLRNKADRVETIPEKKCSVEGCEERHYGNGFCQSHMIRIQNALRLKSSRNSQKGQTCQHPNCVQSAKTKGYCTKHYARFYRHGDASVVNKRGRVAMVSRSKCKYDKCSRMAKSAGYCPACYQMYRKYGTPDVLRKPGRRKQTS